MRLSSTFSQNRTVVSGAWHGARFLFFSGLFGILLVAGPAALRAQCPTVLAIMVDACGTEALNEFVIINSGGGFNTSNLQLSFDVNNNIIGPQNNDINIDINNLPGGPCGLQPGNPALIAGCANVIAVGPGVDIPANSTVVIQTSANADAVYDFAVVCGAGGCIYVIQNTCVRNAGGFTNGGGGGPRTTILAVSNLPGCFFSYVYNTTLLSGVNGDYFMPPAGFGNAGCTAPPVGSPPPPVTPALTPQGPFCSNAAPVNLPTTQSGIIGTWSGPGVAGGTVFNPATAGNGTHTLTFTPDAGQCANPNTIMVTVNSPTTPTFTQLGPYCQGDTPAALPTTSTNGITGTWSPAAISTAALGTATYTFTPNVGQCATPTTMMVTVTASTTPTFTQLGPYCQNQTPDPLPTTSTNGITGTWSPAAISTAALGTATYTFTPNVGQCAMPTTMMVTVTASITPAFTQLGPYCQNQTPDPLPTTSTNGITGTWSPAAISTAALGTATYTFTPNVGQCATPTTMMVTVNASTTATFNPIGPLCVGETPPALPATSTNSITGTWNPATISTAAPGTITYTFTPDAGSCGTGTTLDVTVNPGATPAFTQLGPYCQGDTPAALPTTSNNGISGSWNPAAISTAAPGNTVYTFTPNAGQCASAQTMTITVNPGVTPTFTQLGPYCQGDTPAALPATSNNGITGSWNPAVISTAMFGVTVYTFTPNAGQCASAQTMTITVNPGTTPVFNQLGPYCQGQAPDPLPATSLNGISGSWNPAAINTAMPGVVVYTFTPNAGQCAVSQTMTVTVDPSAAPVFTQLGPYCLGQTPDPLPTTSLNGVNGSWNPPVINTAQPGVLTYTFTPTGQCATAQTMMVTVNAPPVANTPGPLQFCVLFIPPTLLSENSASVLNQITGGNPGLTVSWFFDAAATMPILNINSIFSIIPPPTTVYANVSNGSCSSATVPVNVVITQPPVLNNPGPQSACQSYTLPPITGLNLPGNQAYYTGTNGTGTQLQPGQTITATTTLFIYAGSGNCFDQEQFTITITPPPTANPAGPLQVCDNGAGLGQFNLSSVNAVISGGTGTVSWFTNAGATNPIGNPAAFVSGPTTVYATLTVGGCTSAPLPVVLQLIPAPVANPAGPLQLCDNGAGIGVFQLTMLNGVISGGFGIVSWFTNPAATIPVPNPDGHLSGNTTVYAVVSNGGCVSVPRPVVLELLPVPIANTPVVPLQACVSIPPNAIFNLNDFDLIISGGTGTVNWFSNAGGSIPINNPGSYASSTGTVYAVVSNGGCNSQPVPVVLQANPLPVVSLSAAQPISCNSSADGAINTTVSGVPGPYTFDWNFNPIDGIQNPTGLAAGNYSVVVTATSTGCAGVANITLTGPAALVLVCAQGSPVSAPGGTDGVGSVTVSGGTPGYTIAWSGPQSGSQILAAPGTSSIANLQVGTYSVTVTDSNDCVQTCTFVIGLPGCGITLGITGTNLLCNGDNTGAISLTVNNANGSLDFNWNVDSLDGVQNPTGLPAGAYTVIVTDALGCTATASVTLTQPSPIVLICNEQNPASSAGAADGSATVIVSGGAPGYTVIWSGPVSDTITVPTADTLTISNLVVGVYTILITDANGCESICTFTIQDGSTCNLQLTIAATGPLCSGDTDGAITLTVTGSTGVLTFDWNDNSLDGQQNPTGLAPGFYSVIVTDALGCADAISITLTDPAPLLLMCAQTNPVSAPGANDGSASITINGGVPGYLVEWSDGINTAMFNVAAPGTASLTGLAGGDYFVLVTDANGCQAFCQFTIVEPVICNLTFDVTVTNPTCNGSANGAIIADVAGATGNLTVVWNISSLNGTLKPTGLSGGTYSVTVTDDNNCTASTTITVIEPDPILLICSQLNPASSDSAADGAATMTVGGGTPGYILIWDGPVSGSTTTTQPGDYNINNLPAGDYTLTVRDAANCVVTCQVTIEKPLCDIGLLISGVNPRCNGGADGSVSLNITNATGAIFYDWNNDNLDGIQNPTGLVAGAYSVTITDQTGCESTNSIVLTQPSAVVLVCAQEIPLSRVGANDGRGIVILSGGVPGYAVSWSGPISGSTILPGADTLRIPALPPGAYTVTATDANGCEVNCTFVIDDIFCGIDVSVDATNPACLGSNTGSILLSVDNAYGSVSFDWNDNTLDGQQNPSGLGAGTYIVVITDSLGCAIQTMIMLTDPAAIALMCAQANPVSAVGANDGSASVQVSGGTPGYTVSWSGPANGSQMIASAGTVNIPNLPDGTYTVTVTDANGCEQTCSFIITPPCAITADISATDPACNGNSDGAINLTVNNGVGNLTFDWNDNTLDGIQSPTGLPAGAYSVVVTDSTGCTTTATVTLTEPSAIVLVCAEQNQVSTIGGNDGSATVQISGGTAGYTVVWSGPASGSQNQPAAGTATLTDLLAGNYTVTVTDDNGCEATCTFTIGTVGCNFTLDITALNPACSGEDNGIIFVIVNGGTPGFSFDWSVDALDGIQDPSGLPAGNYAVTVTDGIGCVATTSITLVDPPVLTLACAQQNPASTIGGNDGSGAVAITGGVAVYNVNYTGPLSGDETADAEGTTILGNLLPGAYNIEVTDSNGCVETCTFTIGDPSCSLALNIAGTNPLCDGDDNGSISLTVTNATGNSTFDWNVDALDGIQSPNGLTAGTYSVTVTDDGGCTVSTSVTLSAPAAIALVCAQQNPVSTVGGNNGTATVQISGGMAGYTVAWSGPASGSQNQPAAGTATLTGLIAGDYTVIVTDANGCEATCTFTVDGPNCNIALNIAGTNPLCNGGSTGSISLTVNNATGNLTFDWNDNSLDGIQNPSGLAAGAYSVTVTDGAGCTADATVTLSAPALLEIVCTQQSPVITPGGNEGSAGVQISGGTAPYTVAWSGPLSGSQNQATAGTVTIPDLSAGNYTIVVTDANGCETTCTLTFADPSCNLTFTMAGTNPSCNGSLDGSITLTLSGVNGNATFAWSNTALNGIQNPTGLPAGAYSVVVTDDAGCSATDAVVLVNPAALALVCAQQNPVSTVGGNNGTATVQISGGTAGYTVAWSGAASGSQNQPVAGTATITGLIAGNYTITVTDANGCTSTCTFTITGPICNLTLNIAGNNPLCNGGNTGSINLAVNGAIGTPTFDWNDNSLDGIQNPSGLTAGTYSVTVTDGAGCTANASVTLNAPAAIALVCAQQNPVSTVGGNNGTATVQISGGTAGYTVAWSGAASGSQNQTAAGTATITGLVAGSYTITVTDANGCTSTCTFTITGPICNLTLNIAGNNPLCNGGNTGSINLAVNGAIGTPTFDWNDNSLDGIQNPTGLIAGTYSVIVADGAGCTATASVTLTAPAAIALVCAQQNPVSTVGGNNGSATVQISGGTAGYTVAWSGAASGSQNQTAAGTATITGLIAGNYTITVTDANGCTSTCSFVIGAHNCNLSLNISGTNPLCSGGSTGGINLAVNNSTGNLTFDWNNNSLDGIQNPAGLPAGTYSVIVTDGAGCTASASVTLSDPAALAFTASGTGPDCFNTDDGFITIESITGGVPPYEYSIQGGIFTAAGAFPLTRPGLTPGAYTILVRDANGCTAQRNLTISSPQVYTLDLGPDLFVELGDSIRLEGLANFDIDSVVWTPQRFLSDPSNPATFVRPTETTGYRLTAFDINGCKAEDDIIVYVQRVLNVFVPNAFSPNDDGINDVLLVFADDKITQVKTFRIFDRWGNMLFFNGPFPPNDPQYGWDGEFNGRPMNAGVYVFAAEVEYVDGRIELIKGEVMLMR